MNKTITRILMSVLLFITTAALSALAQKVTLVTLEDGFSDPPREARPTVWWYMGEGPTTKEGITHDLEAYKRAGFGGVQWYEQPFGKRTDVLQSLSPEWHGMVKHAQADCKRLGLFFEIAVSSGYVTGGKWITPELGMQRLISSEICVQGPRDIDALLPQPQGIRLNYYKDIAVLAFRSPESAPVERKPRVTANLPVDGLEKLVDGNERTGVQIKPPLGDQPVEIVLEYPKTVTARSLTISMAPWVYSARAYALNRLLPSPGELESGDDGIHYRTVCELPVLYSNWGGSDGKRTISFPATTNKFFRLHFHRWDGPKSSREKALVLNEIDLGNTARVDRFEEKAGFVADYPAPDRTPRYAPSECVSLDQVLDLTTNLSADGKLHWKVPPGNWTILRLGHSPTGVTTKHGRPELMGLECDKLSPLAAEVQFNHYAKLAYDDSVAAGAPMQGVLIDSAEYGPQNWTPAFRDEFKKRRGYDMTPWLPVMRGYVVGTPEMSDRFLFDVRRTIADLLADYQFGKLAQLAAERGMWICAQAPGCGMGIDADVIQCKGRAQMPMGEFWMHDMPQTGYMDIKDASSGAHVYGRRIAASEAFTEADLTHSPESFLHNGNSALLGGINRFATLAGNHQPWDDRKPGLLSYWRSVPFQRHNTWWELSRASWDYWARCCYLLQQGHSVADVCYSLGEDVPSRILPWQLKPSLPEGLDYDACSAEAILTRMQAKDGRIVLPDGMSYRVLVLPPTPRMTLPLVRKLKELVENGATIVAPRPTSSPSLADFGSGDAEIARIASNVWADCDGTNSTEHAFGRGRVIWGKSLETILQNPGPDCVFSEAGKSAFKFIHRQDKDTDIYFVVNASSHETATVANFRVDGKRPELWHPLTGQIEQAARYVRKNGRTEVPLSLEQQEGLFVIFRAPAISDAIVSLKKDGAECNSAKLSVSDGHLTLLASEPGSYELQSASGSNQTITVNSVAKAIKLDGPWTVRFPPRWGAPESVVFDKLISWSQHADPGVKYFSGTATYTKEVNLAPELFPQKQLLLDLGAVKVLARVRLNGRDLGSLWKAPFRVDISTAAHSGTNTLEIDVVNLWQNRLIGDLSLPEEKRFTWTTMNPYNAQSPLTESGLLGPVTIQPHQRVELR